MKRPLWKPFRQRNPRIVGAVSLAVLVALVAVAFKIDDLAALTAAGSYRAAFRDASGLAPGNEVRVAGVRVGKVTAVELAGARAGGPATPYVRVRFRVDEDGIRLGRETAASKDTTRGSILPAFRSAMPSASSDTRLS